MMFIRLIGEMDQENIGNLRDKLISIIKEKNVRDVVFNLKELTFMDSTGIGIIIGRYNQLKFKGGKGIASSIGVFLTCESIHGGAWLAVAIMALLAAALFIYFTEFGAMGSFIAITPPAVGASIRLFLLYGNLLDV